MKTLHTKDINKIFKYFINDLTFNRIEKEYKLYISEELFKYFNITFDIDKPTVFYIREPSIRKGLSITPTNTALFKTVTFYIMSIEFLPEYTICLNKTIYDIDLNYIDKNNNDELCVSDCRDFEIIQLKY